MNKLPPNSSEDDQKAAEEEEVSSEIENPQQNPQQSTENNYSVPSSIISDAKISSRSSSGSKILRHGEAASQHSGQKVKRDGSTASTLDQKSLRQESTTHNNFEAKEEEPNSFKSQQKLDSQNSQSQKFYDNGLSDAQLQNLVELQSKREVTKTTNRQNESVVRERYQIETFTLPNDDPPEEREVEKDEAPESQNEEETEIQSEESGSTRDDTDKTVFPFKSSSSGTLKVMKNMIAFENGQVAVLVNDAKRTRVSVQQEGENSSVSQSTGRRISDERPGQSVPVQNIEDGHSEDRSSVSGHHGTKNSSSYRHQHPFECHKTNQHGHPSGTSDLIENFHYRLRRAIHPDTTIVIGKKEFPCHGIALQIYSQYFDCMKRPTETIHRIHLPEDIIKPEEFPTLMDWILLDDWAKPLVINKGNVVQLYAASQYLGISGLKEQCKNFLHEKLENGDPLALKIYEEVRKRPNCKELRNCLASKFADVFPSVYKSNQFLCLGVEELVMLISSDDVLIQSELDIYDVAARWLLHDWCNRQKQAVRVMRCVRFGLLTPLELTQIMRCADASSVMPDYTKIFSFPEIKDLVHGGLTYAIFRESYTSCPEEMSKWMEWSKIQSPRPRHHVRTGGHHKIPDEVPSPMIEKRLCHDHENESRMPRQSPQPTKETWNTTRNERRISKTNADENLEPPKPKIEPKSPPQSSSSSQKSHVAGNNKEKR